jgi:hypothetical protein
MRNIAVSVLAVLLAVGPAFATASTTHKTHKPTTHAKKSSKPKMASSKTHKSHGAAPAPSKSGQDLDTKLDKK